MSRLLHPGLSQNCPHVNRLATLGRWRIGCVIAAPPAKLQHPPLLTWTEHARKSHCSRNLLERRLAAKEPFAIMEHPGAPIFHLPNAAETAALHNCEKPFSAAEIVLAHHHRGLRCVPPPAIHVLPLCGGGRACRSAAQFRPDESLPPEGRKAIEATQRAMCEHFSAPRSE